MSVFQAEDQPLSQSVPQAVIMPMSLFCLLSEHQAALLQLKRECKEELERMHVSSPVT